MRRIALSAAVLLTAGLAGHAAAQDRPAAYTNAETCLVQNADAAVAASSGATDAAEFLLTYLCAGPVGAATSYEVNSRLLASGRGMVEGFLTLMPETTATSDMSEMPDFSTMTDEEVEAWLEQEAETAAAEPPVGPEGALPAMPAMPTDPFEGIAIDPVTGQVVTGENPMGPLVVTFIDYMEATGRAMSGTPPVFLRERAAQLVVERRRR